ncbi:ubiquitin-conjugating enzyme E2 J2 isoform X7 [Salmo salar]|uniref:Ubiquitin-conjugating enzyme E2 J2 isoform X7 n=1 Tax=Salmo salar TaxID=8030 RepID=A0A1S3M901_SALSA|nr:ubiquitin-conjugating enzyme E2 J2 isoform X7 [Salmo salar]|eukprot:XP_013999668.1 PREDICTED: ubiquitin-conjugating enzyme E2 J2-like isoform X4 [Salmo salar]
MDHYHAPVSKQGQRKKYIANGGRFSRGSFSCRPAVKRLMKEAAELRDPTEHYHAQPLEDNLFEWHFSVRGPPDSDFDGGVYHGRIVLPPEYPMKPPSIILLTPNGRFEVGKKICLSISGHHPETWQPSWSIRTALIAIIGFMPTKGEGAIGSLDYNPEERRGLAKKQKPGRLVRAQGQRAGPPQTPGEIRPPRGDRRRKRPTLSSRPRQLRLPVRTSHVPQPQAAVLSAPASAGPSSTRESPPAGPPSLPPPTPLRAPATQALWCSSWCSPCSCLPSSSAGST